MKKSTSQEFRTGFAQTVIILTPFTALPISTSAAATLDIISWWLIWEQTVISTSNYYMTTTFSSQYFHFYRTWNWRTLFSLILRRLSSWSLHGYRYCYINNRCSQRCMFVDNTSVQRQFRNALMNPGNVVKLLKVFSAQNCLFTTSTTVMNIYSSTASLQASCKLVIS